ncbi:DUF3089 domain-containing protein [Caulobacter segnis]|uniref:DUF3089 domain-containing protein n=1 Tax=Caulobacter segnis TaxID=88688 RepID=UPI0024107556|nr:DUF3089 domain-containing protein [Caulobacter segnis]MDG2522585.1 DUF3089 domain-containing protein [Caulobacter segnis]
MRRLGYRRKSAPLLAGLAALSFAVQARAQAAPAPLDYTLTANWVCRPGSQSCQWNLDATRIGGDGVGHVEPFLKAQKTPADCFYLYPTVSQDPGLIAAPGVTEAELRAVRQQVARLGRVCRIYAPFHRQFTATSMRPDFAKPERSVYRAAGRIGEADVLAAWDHYMAHDNKGRPFVIIGHSQGANRAIDLIKARIDGKPAQSRLLSAILPGAFVMVPSGGQVGGTFKNIPPCRDARQTSCFMAFNAIREETRLAEDVRPDFPGSDLVCTNPANLAGGSGVLEPYLSTTGETILPELTAEQKPWTVNNDAIKTPFVNLSGMLSARCRVDVHGAFLVVGINREPKDKRPGDFTGDWLADGRPLDVMGLHILDLNLVAGNLADVIRTQTEARQAAKP